MFDTRTRIRFSVPVRVPPNAPGYRVPEIFGYRVPKILGYPDRHPAVPYLKVEVNLALLAKDAFTEICSAWQYHAPLGTLGCMMLLMLMLMLGCMMLSLAVAFNASMC